MRGLIQTLLSLILDTYRYLLTVGRIVLADKTFTTSKSIFFTLIRPLTYDTNEILEFHPLEPDPK